MSPHIHKKEWRTLPMFALLLCDHKLFLCFLLRHFNMYVAVTGLATLWWISKELSMNNLDESDVFIHTIPVDILKKAPFKWVKA